VTAAQIALCEYESKWFEIDADLESAASLVKIP
jgi:hypothetical protein